MCIWNALRIPLIEFVPFYVFDPFYFINAGIEFNEIR